MTKFSGKLSSAVGPILFFSTFKFVETLYEGSDSQIQIAYRYSIAALTIFLAIGFYILMKYVPNQSKEFKIRKGTAFLPGKDQYIFRI